MKKTNQKGSSMIEVMGVMAILGMATIGIYAGISNVQGRFRLANGYDEIKRVIKSMRKDANCSRILLMTLLISSYPLARRKRP